MPNRRSPVRIRFVTAALAGAAGTLALTGALPSVLGPDLAAHAAAPEVKVGKAGEIKTALKKLYGDTKDADIVSAKEAICSEIDALIAKDPKNSALKAPSFWVDAIKEVRFTGKARKSANPKSVQKAEAVGADPNGTKIPYLYHGGVAYSPKTAAPLLICVLDKGADADAHIKSWLANEDVQKNWVIVAVTQSDAIDFKKNPEFLTSVFVQSRNLFNTDPNRVYVEGVGASAVTVQQAAADQFPDRLAGLILRNPQEAKATKNATAFTTVVVHGAEANEKALAVHEEYKKLNADRAAVVVAPDTASVQSTCPPLAEWLKGHAGRKLANEYEWSTTVTETAGAVFTGNFLIHSVIARGSPTTLKVGFLRDSNTVNIEAENLDEFQVFMNDEYLDLDKPVAIFVNGKEVKKAVFERSTRTLIDLANETGEFGRFFPSMFRGRVAPVEKAAAAPADGEKK